MGMRLEGGDQVLVHLQTASGKMKKGVGDRLLKAAQEIQALARKMAPVDLGNLEDAIKIEGSGGGRDEMGRFTKKEYVVYVDMEHPAEGREAGVLVGQYAMYMHEGDYGLGYKSFAKQMSNPEVEVGPKFLERAADEVAKELEKKMIEAAFALL